MFSWSVALSLYQLFKFFVLLHGKYLPILAKVKPHIRDFRDMKSAIPLFYGNEPESES